MNPHELSHPDQPTKSIAAWVADFSIDDAPPAVLDKVRHQILDALACGLVGAHLPWSEIAVRTYQDLEGSCDGAGSYVWGWGHKATAPTAALLNGSFVQGFELDDYYEKGPLHPGSVIVPPLLAIAEHYDLTDGADLMAGATVGYEIGPRLGVALDSFELVRRGFHCGSVLGIVVSAVASSRFRRLNAEQVEDAIGIAATQACGLMGTQYEAMVKRMNHGFAARGGLSAAALAGAGYSGMKESIERGYGGLQSSFNPDTSDLAPLTADLGGEWRIPEIGVKPYAAMGQTHPTIDAVLALRDEHGLTADDVTKLVVELPEVPYLHGGFKLTRPTTAIGAQMSATYSAAIAMLDGVPLVDQYTPTRLDADDVWDMLARVEPVHSTEMDELCAQLGKRRVTRVTAHTSDGREVSVLKEHGKGHSEDILTHEEIREKFRHLTGRIMPAASVEKLEAAVMDIENQLGDVLTILAEPVDSPF